MTTSQESQTNTIIYFGLTFPFVYSLEIDQTCYNLSLVSLSVCSLSTFNQPCHQNGCNLLDDLCTDPIALLCLSLSLRNTRSLIMAALSKFYSSSLVDAALSLSLHNRYGLCPHPAPPNNAGIVPVWCSWWWWRRNYTLSGMPGARNLLPMISIKANERARTVDWKHSG